MKEVKIASKEKLLKYLGQTIDNKTLVELFGSSTNKKTYQKAKRVTNTLKATLLKRASLACVVIDLTGGRYEIKEIFENKVPEKIQRINNRDSSEKIILIKILKFFIENQEGILLKDLNEKISNYSNILKTHKDDKDSKIIDNFTHILKSGKLAQLQTEGISNIVNNIIKILEDLKVLNCYKVYYQYNKNYEFFEVSEEIDLEITKKIPNRIINPYNLEHNDFIKTLNIGKVYSMTKIIDIDAERAEYVMTYVDECDELNLDIDIELIKSLRKSFRYIHCKKIQESIDYFIEKELNLLLHYKNGDKDDVLKICKELFDKKNSLMNLDFWTYLIFSIWKAQKKSLGMD